MFTTVGQLQKEQESRAAGEREKKEPFEAGQRPQLHHLRHQLQAEFDRKVSEPPLILAELGEFLLKLSLSVPLCLSYTGPSQTLSGRSWTRSRGTRNTFSRL